jgi:hypothetical protein
MEEEVLAGPMSFESSAYRVVLLLVMRGSSFM